MDESLFMHTLIAVVTRLHQDRIKYARSKTVEEFKKKWEFVGDRPKEGNYPSRSQGNSY